jgi:hypothetical protein
VTVFNNLSTRYNQEGLVEDKDLIASAIQSASTGAKYDPASIAQSTIRVPAYTIATYDSGVQAWITQSGNSATRDQVLTIDIDQGKNTSWSDYGFKHVSGGGGVGFWPFFYARVYYNNEWVTRTLNFSGRENDVSIKLAMIGIQKFDIQPGQW